MASVEMCSCNRTQLTRSEFICKCPIKNSSLPKDKNAEIQLEYCKSTKLWKQCNKTFLFS